MDLIYDCRKVKNPHHDPKLRALVGLDDPVRNEVLRSASAREHVQPSHGPVGERLLSTLFQLWRFDNALPAGHSHQDYDRL